MQIVMFKRNSHDYRIYNNWNTVTVGVNHQSINQNIQNYSKNTLETIS